jgi:hypothetical protein
VLQAVAAGANVQSWPAQPKRPANPAYSKECDVTRADTTSTVCIHGDQNGNRTVVVYGDSHASMWIPAFDIIGKQEHWRVAQLTKPGCPVADFPVFSGTFNREYTECAEYRKFALAQLEKIHPDLVILTSAFKVDPMSVKGEKSRDGLEEAWDNGLDEMIKRITPIAGRVVVLGDMAYPSDPGIECLNEHPNDVPKCNTKPSDGIFVEHNANEKRIAEDNGATYVDVIPWLCTQDICPAVIGDLTVHRESFHVNEAYAVWLSQVLGEATGMIPQGASLKPA